MAPSLFELLIKTFVVQNAKHEMSYADKFKRDQQQLQHNNSAIHANNNAAYATFVRMPYNKTNCFVAKPTQHLPDILKKFKVKQQQQAALQYQQQQPRLHEPHEDEHKMRQETRQRLQRQLDAEKIMKQREEARIREELEKRKRHQQRM